MSDDVSIRMSGELARELADVLEHEVETASEHYSTEETMERSAEAIRDNLEGDSDHVVIESSLIEKAADMLGNEGYHATGMGDEERGSGLKKTANELRDKVENNE